MWIFVDRSVSTSIRSYDMCDCQETWGDGCVVCLGYMYVSYLFIFSFNQKNLQDKMALNMLDWHIFWSNLYMPE